MNPNEKNPYESNPGEVPNASEQTLQPIRLLRRATGSFLTINISAGTNAKQYVKDNYAGWQLI